jgi:hypothetical protein
VTTAFLSFHDFVDLGSYPFDLSFLSATYDDYCCANSYVVFCKERAAFEYKYSFPPEFYGLITFLPEFD